MTERQNSPEYDVVCVEPLRRYFDDINRKIEYYFDLKFAADRLVESYIGDSDMAEYVVASSKLFPSTQEAFDNLNERERRERLFMFPFEDVARVVEASGDLVGIRAWYNLLVSKMHTETRDSSHSDACLRSKSHGDKEGFYACPSSALCPWFYTAHMLEKDIVNPDFSRLAYLISNPNMVAGIAESKLDKSVDYGFTQSERAVHLKRRYRNKHNETIGTTKSTS
jgi:hypothetical protein